MIGCRLSNYKLDIVPQMGTGVLALNDITINVTSGQLMVLLLFDNITDDATTTTRLTGFDITEATSFPVTYTDSVIQSLVNANILTEINEREQLAFIINNQFFSERAGTELHILPESTFISRMAPM